MKTLGYSCLLGWLAAAFSTTALAQEQIQKEEITQIEEIMVTAERREANLQDVPIAVSAFQSDAIEKLQIVLLSDLGENVPNLQTYTVTANAAAMQVHMRGASIQNPGLNTSESPVGIYQDDVYRGRLATANLDLSDVERIEVLRGPQGTLYGRNTLAGAIKIISRTPDDDPWINAGLSYGSFETTRAMASVGGPFSDSGWAGSLSGLYHNRDEGYLDNPVYGTEPGEFENKAWRGKLHWYGNDSIDAVLTVWGVDIENDGYNGIPYQPWNTTPGQPVAGFYDNLSPPDVNFGESDQSGVTLDLSFDLKSGMTLRSITAVANFEDDFGFDLAGGGFCVPTAPPAALPCNVTPGEPGLIVDTDSDMDQLSQEFQLLGTSFDDKLEWIAGLYYLNEDGDQDYSILNPFFSFNEATESETTSIAVYAEGTWQFSERWSGTVGLRWTEDDKDYTNVCTDLAPGSCVGGPVSLDEDYSEWTPKFGLQLQVNENELMYFSVAKGFQAGGFQTLCFGNLTPACAGSDYDPQTVWSAEVGYKANLYDNRLRFNLAAFYTWYDDLQQVAALPGPTFPTQNVGEANVAGAEFEVEWIPVNNVRLWGNLGLLNTEYSNLDPNSVAAINNADTLPSAPETTAKAGFDYTLDIWPTIDAYIGGDVYYSDEYYTDATNLLQIDSYSRVNGYIGLGSRDKRWELMLYARNMADNEDNVSGLFVINSTNVRTVLPPREYELMLRVNY